MRSKMKAKVVPPSFEHLDVRLLCARTPSDPIPETLGKSFDLGERQALFARMGNLPASTWKTLQTDLKAGNTGQFDTDLLAYMRNRTSASYYFDPSDAGSIATYVKNNLSTTTQQTHADAVTDNRLFPAASSSGTYTVQLPDAINWNDATPSTNAEFLPTLQRQEWWVDLAQEYRYTGNTKYLSELQYELASYHYQTQAYTLPAKVSGYESYGFTMSIRVDNQVMAYFSVLGSSGWTGADNSLMLYKLLQQGDVLNTVTASLTDYTSNRSVSIGKSTQILGEVFPEFDTSAKWEDNGRKAVFASIGAQFYADGTHREQSPGYTLLVLDDLLEDFQLDKVNGINWSTDQQSTLTNSINALWQELSPNGDRPAIGDTYRLSGIGDFTKAQLALGENDWPDYKAGERDGWIFGTTAVSAHLHDSSTNLGARGDTASFSNSGNYVLRSGTDTSARQINYTAGPKGGDHGHFDYMGFELWGYGRPLIADPGPYIYGTSTQRTWAVSAAAHNTIAVAGVNPADMENSNAILNSGITTLSGGGYMLSSSYQGYSFLDADPTLSRSVYYDGNNTMVIVDFATGSSALSYETGFTLENQNSSFNATTGTIYTQNSSGGNVRIQSLLGAHQTANVLGKGIFTSETADDPANPATRYYVQSNKTTFAVFATVITAYNGSAATAVNNVSWSRMPTKAGQSAILNVNGQQITFTGPQFATVGANGQTRGTYNDVAYDSKGKLHMVFYDRDTNTLKYAVRNTNGVWSNIQTIDGGTDCGVSPSLVIDKNDLPHVAYQDGLNSDLKYAYLDATTGSWQVQTVDVKGSTGGYPSLVMTRNNTAAIAYYNKTNGDLRLATQGSSSWVIQTIDTGTAKGGDVGRFPSLQLDPNRPTATKFAVAYEDTTNGSFKFALQSNSGYAFQTIDNTTTIAGGYISMKYYATGSKTGLAYAPAVTYYDAGKGRLKYAVSDNTKWATTVVASRKRQGLYSKLLIVNNTPNIFFFDGTSNDEYFLSSTKISGGKWSLGLLGDGGREVHAAVYNGKFTYTNLNESTGFLTVGGA